MQPQKLFHVELSTLQLDLIRRALDLELYAHESGFNHPNPKLLKKTAGQFIDLLKPTPQEQQQSLQNWVRKIYRQPAALTSFGVMCHE